MTPETLPCCYALVPAAGRGSRAGGDIPKQYALLNGGPVVAHALAALASVQRIRQTLVVLGPRDELFAQRVPEAACWTAKVGGASRAASVRQGLEELSRRGVRPHDWVLVHDAARCLVRPEWIDRLIDACLADGVGGLLALPLADTLKSAQADRVEATLDRGHKWLAQTPQMFRWGLLHEALARADGAVTDEASAVEALGHRPLLVVGDIENFKLTHPPDFALAERLLSSRP